MLLIRRSNGWLWPNRSIAATSSARNAAMTSGIGGRGEVPVVATIWGHMEVGETKFPA